MSTNDKQNSHEPMSRKQFIKDNVEQIDEIIRAVLKEPTRRFNNKERELWILNHEVLYNWARSEGVEI